MHDSIGLESDGVPAVAVATSAFTDAAALQAERLGMSEYETVIVPHPVQNATDEEIAERAEKALERLVALLAG